MFILDENDDEMFRVINIASGKCWDFSGETLASKLPKYGRSGPLLTAAQTQSHINSFRISRSKSLAPLRPQSSAPISLCVISQTKSDGDWWLADYSEDPIRVSTFVMIIYNEYL